jgi:anthranilate synthase component 1
VLAYRCLVPDARDSASPSFLLESVVNGDSAGRFSFVGARPALEVVASRSRVAVLDHESGERTVLENEGDPLGVAARIARGWKPARVEGLPGSGSGTSSSTSGTSSGVFTGGFVGYAGYDTVRYVYGSKIPFSDTPPDDRRLPDLNLALYNDVVVFDQATKIAYAICWVHLDGGAGAGGGVAAALASADNDDAPAPAPRERTDADLHPLHAQAIARLQGLVAQLSSPPPLPTALPPAAVDLALSQRPASPGKSNMTEAEFMAAIAQAKEHIAAGDVFQLVLSQRFERRTFADPFEIYRALRVVNPSPYMVYMQARGCVVVSSSPEILCRVDDRRVVTNRPLAGTRRRGVDQEQDLALERELLADEKERAEHVMLVDLGRNDVGRVAESGTVAVERLMEVERYSHVMHISSTVTGTLRPELDAWDALRAALPAGTVSGAPKVRAMQAIDALEAAKRGPYGGGIGHVAFGGSMDMALGLRTMVIPTADEDGLYSYGSQGGGGSGSGSGNGGGRPARARREWAVHLQAGAGIVADSVPAAEFEETVNKAAALGRAIDLAEQAFVLSDGP